MTKLPKPSSWSAHYDLTYNAWNRLVTVSDTGTTVAGYEYDGRNFRTIKRTYTSGSLAETRHFFYNTNWQCLEERLETSGAISSYANRQDVWGFRYTDDLVLRDRDADGSSGTGDLGMTGSGLDERLYAMQDPNWNVVAIANTSGAVQERYCYSAYGTPAFLTSVFATRTPDTSSYAWDALYTGREYDSETALYHYRNRSYSAELGRFTGRDPIGYFLPNVADDDSSVGWMATLGGPINANATASNINDLNLYRYVGNEPLDCFDPTGEAEHTSGARPSTADKHTNPRPGDPEKGDASRRPPRQRPPNWKGPWPPKRYDGQMCCGRSRSRYDSVDNRKCVVGDSRRPFPRRALNLSYKRIG